jgi:hypothetical protein
LWDAVVEAGKDGLLTEQEQLRITMPIWYRSLADLKAPFGAGGRFGTLRLEQLYAPDPFWAAFEQTGDS